MGDFLENFDISEEAVALDVALQIVNHAQPIRLCRTCGIYAIDSFPCRFKGHRHATTEFFMLVTEFVIIDKMIQGRNNEISSLNSRALSRSEHHISVPVASRSLVSKGLVKKAGYGYSYGNYYILSEEGKSYYDETKEELERSARYTDAKEFYAAVRRELDPTAPINEWFKLYEDKLLYHWICNISDEEYLKWKNESREKQLQYAKVIWDMELEGINF